MATVFDHPEFDDHERITHVRDPATGLFAVNDVNRAIGGRAGGGIRFRTYATDAQALTDVLRLSKTMTWKMVLADLPVGGAKTVVIGDPARLKTPALLRALGGFIESMGGLYLAGPDIGTDAHDMTELARTTRFVAGRSDQSGSTAIPTAEGGFNAIRAAAKACFGSDNLDGLRIAVQGVGGVGRELIVRLTAAGARIVAADVNGAAAEEARARYGAEVVAPDEILQAPADILSPNALGGILDERSIPLLSVRAICGCANNQLANASCAGLLHERGIFWVPDYVASAGGAIDGCKDAGLITPDGRNARLARIYDTALEVFKRAEAGGVPTEAAAQAMARARLAAKG